MDTGKLNMLSAFITFKNMMCETSIALASNSLLENIQSFRWTDDWTDLQHYVPDQSIWAHKRWAFKPCVPAKPFPPLRAGWRWPPPVEIWDGMSCGPAAYHILQRQKCNNIFTSALINDSKNGDITNNLLITANPKILVSNQSIGCNFSKTYGYSSDFISMDFKALQNFYTESKNVFANLWIVTFVHSWYKTANSKPKFVWYLSFK